MNLSIVMCNYNFAHYIQYALDGIVEQTQLPLELLLVDDGSTDASLDVIQLYVDKYPWIKFHRNQKNMGAYKSAQFALERARGEYVYFACSDDRILPTFVEENMKALREFPEAGLSCSFPAFFQEDEIYQEPIQAPTTAIWMPPKEAHKRCLGRLWIPGHTAVYKREQVIRAGGVQECLGHLCDWFFSQVIAFRSGIAFIPKILAAKRNHSQMLSAKCAHDITKYCSLLQLLQLPEYKDIRTQFYHARILRKQGDHFVRALKRLDFDKGMRLKLLVMNRLVKTMLWKSLRQWIRSD